MPADQDVVESLRELKSSVQDLVNIISPAHHISHPEKTRASLRAKDEISKAIYEKIEKGIPEEIPDWKENELMPADEIEMENKRFAQIYEDFWNSIDESTQLEKELAEQAYTSAFSRFGEIYSLFGWQRTRYDTEEDALFDKQTLTESRGLLIASIFGIEAYQKLRYNDLTERSRAVFEFSRLPRLLIILVRITCMQQYIVSACGAEKVIIERPFDALTITRVLALVSRLLREGGHILSMEKFLHQCYARRILKQPGATEIDIYRKQCELLYDCMTSLDFTKNFREIRHPLNEVFFIRYKSEPIHVMFKLIKAHDMAMIGINRFPELPLKECTDSMFQPEIFTVSHLMDFGQLNIEWTDCLDEHLKIYANRNCIRIFAHPTFYYDCVDLHREYRDHSSPVHFELSLTYALLFRPTSSKNLRQLEKYNKAGWERNGVSFCGRPILRSASPDAGQGISDKTLDINPLKSPTKDILSENFYRCSLPPCTQVGLNIANPSEAVNKIHMGIEEHKITTTSMRQIFDLAPMYPEDITFMITSIMETRFLETESFLRFPYFAPRLRRLKRYLDSRQPSTLHQLWCDRRDYQSWCKFWGVGFFGCCSLLLLLGILLMQVIS